MNKTLILWLSYLGAVVLFWDAPLGEYTFGIVIVSVMIIITYIGQEMYEEKRSVINNG